MGRNILPAMRAHARTISGQIAPVYRFCIAKTFNTAYAKPLGAAHLKGGDGSVDSEFWYMIAVDGLAPIIANIILFHIFLDLPGLPLALVVLVCEIILIIGFWQSHIQRHLKEVHTII